MAYPLGWLFRFEYLLLKSKAPDQKVAETGVLFLMARKQHVLWRNDLESESYG